MLNTSCNREPVTRAARLLALLVTVAITVPVAAATLTERIEVTPFVKGADRDIVLTEAPLVPEAPVIAPPVTRRVIPRLAAAALPMAAALAPAVTAAPQQPASWSATVHDQSGAVVPGVEVTLTNTASGMGQTTYTDASGQLIFRSLVPAQYRFVARLPGFRTVTDVLNVAEGQDLRSNLLLPIGQLAETLVVECRAVGAALLRGDAGPALSLARRSTVTRLFPPLHDARVEQPALAAQAVPIRVGGQIMAPRQIKKVQPVCPAVTPGAGLVVILEATIGVDGLIKDLKVLRPQPADDKQTGYVQAALDAVRQWEYTPTRLNNVPTPVIATVTVTFVVPASPN